MALQIRAGSIRLIAPSWVARSELARFVSGRADWIVATLQRQRCRQAEPTTAMPLVIAAGERLLFEGRECRIRVDATLQEVIWPAADDDALLQLPVTCLVPARLRQQLCARALQSFSMRVPDHCGRLGVPVPPVRLTDARTRWGSCSARTGIRLNWRLIHLPRELTEYVIAHEVSHLLEMNHSSAFWRLVERLHPDWQNARQQLKDWNNRLPVWPDAS